MGKLYNKITDHITHCDNGHILEIGMDRGEGSTDAFIKLARKRGVHYVGVDIEPKQHTGEHVHVHTMTGEKYLSDNTKQFSIVYLDNFDWNYWTPNHSTIEKQSKVYEKQMQTELTNVNSQKSHLLQAIALEEYLTPNATIMCDDTWWEPKYMVWMGKCSSAIPFLLSIGFEVAHTEGVANSPPSCVILTRRA